MTKDEKISFTLSVLERESEKYIKSPLGYDREDEVWLDRFITSSNFENSLRMNESNLELAYQAALKLSQRT